MEMQPETCSRFLSQPDIAVHNCNARFEGQGVEDLKQTGQFPAIELPWLIGFNLLNFYGILGHWSCVDPGLHQDACSMRTLGSVVDVEERNCHVRPK